MLELEGKYRTPSSGTSKRVSSLSADLASCNANHAGKSRLHLWLLPSDVLTRITAFHFWSTKLACACVCGRLLPRRKLQPPLREQWGLVVSGKAGEAVSSILRPEQALKAPFAARCRGREMYKSPNVGSHQTRDELLFGRQRCLLGFPVLVVTFFLCGENFP
jgi:hypothetical protein